MGFDIWLFNAINQLPHASWSDAAALFISYMGNRGIASGIALILIVVGFYRESRKLWENSLAVLVGTLFGGLIVDLLKMIIARPRPYEVLSDVYLVGEASGASFPSGHSTFYAFFVSYLLIRVIKRRQMIWVTLAFLGGFVRVYQGFHYPSDVVGGWVLGAVLGWLLAFFFSSFNVLRYNGN